ncbi:MAG: flagellar basal body P-ring formation chaperone FlgA [Desulfobacterales bacterium]|jgi:flagella basal body P-ring formation protein FlgA
MNASILTFKKSEWLGFGLLILLIIAPILLFAAAPAVAEITTIRVRDQVEIDDDEVLLGQIASIESSDTQFVQRLKHIVIGKAPLPGRTRQYEQRHLKMRLKQHHVDLGAIHLEGSRYVKILRSHIEIDKHQIKKIISDFITQNNLEQNKSVRIKEIHVFERVVLPKGRIAYKVRAPSMQQLKGTCSIAIDFSVNGHFEKKVRATAIVEVWGPVVVTRRPLGRYKPITEDDIMLQTMDLTNLSANVVSDPEAVLGKRTKRAIGAQTPLRADSIELPPLVKRGDLVVIIAESKGLKITTRGVVKKKGRLGDRIPVVNVDSKKVLYARVIDSNTVQVDF